VAYEVIPFNVFTVRPDPSILSMVDGGLTFFIGTGVVLLGLIVAEKFGLPINNTFVKVLVYTGIGVSFLLFVLKSPLFRGLLAGY
jgi:hypothetical protein